MEKKGTSPLIFLFIAILIASIIPILSPPYYVLHIVTVSLLFAYLCTSWALVGGYAGQVSLGHSAFVGIGAYLTAIILYRFKLSLLLGVSLGILTAIGIALVLGYACFKFGVRGPYFTFSTMALAEILYMLVISRREITGGALGIVVPVEALRKLPINPKIACYYIILFMFLAVVFLARKIQYSKLGYYLVAIREDEEAAEACGINVLKYKLLALCLSSALTALGGVFYAIYYGYITPDGVLSLSLSFQIATTSLVGGAKIWFGPALGALLVIPFTEITRSLLGGTFIGVPLLLYGILLVIVARVAPNGIYEIFSKYFVKEEERG